MEKLSSTLKQLLNEANISEAELARRTGIAQPMVNRLATGKNKNPKLETLKPIAKYFSVTFSQLLGEEDLPNSDKRNDSYNQSFQLPVVEWSNFDNSNYSQMIATTAKVSSKAFALLISNNEFEPRFPANSVLTIEPETTFNPNDFILVKNLASNDLMLAQVKQSADNSNLALHNVNNTSTEQEVVLDPAQYQVLGVLVQTSYDFK
ncbi:MAG: helix-turn-helix transcriptional regulator [Gammaproteobacteria bacterium]|nr:helix-turn-helix transcriptional regulator [Gammaproteobacteria bacterium]